MDRTSEFESLTSTQHHSGVKKYTPLDDATSLITKIMKMKSHLHKYGHDYLNTYGCLAGASIMTDERRNKLNQDIDEFIKVCNQKIKILQSEIWIGTNSNQVIEHRKAMIEIMMRIFNDFVKCCTHLRTTRMMRDIEKEKFERVEIISKKKRLDEAIDPLSNDLIDLDSLKDITQTTCDDSDNKQVSTRSIQANLTQDDWQQQSILAAEHDIHISPQEAQMLAVENSRIHEELMTLSDEINLIGKKVIQISKLQELFSDKVMEQEMELNQLHETTIRSSENVREGNDLIRDAMMKNASTRVFILFYILVLAFTILFLDWYNP